jgi:hypothetical protein
MFCAPGLIFGSSEGVVSHFHLLRPRTRFRRYRARRVPFSCFAPPDSFSVIPKVSGPVFIFSALGLIFDGTEGVGYRFPVLRSLNLFRWYQGRRVPFLCFALPDSFSALPRASDPFFMFCAPGLVFGGAEGVGSRLHVLRAHSRFQRNLWPLSCFALPYSFSAVPRATGTVFLFCAPELIFDDTGGVVSRFHVLHSRSHFRRYQGRRVPFSCFSRPDSFTVVTRASGPVVMFCSPGHVFGGAEGVGSRFHVLRSRTLFRRFQRRRVPSPYFVLPDSF